MLEIGRDPARQRFSDTPKSPAGHGPLLASGSANGEAGAAPAAVQRMEPFSSSLRRHCHSHLPVIRTRRRSPGERHY